MNTNILYPLKFKLMALYYHTFISKNYTYINRVPETMPLYDILNEFQKGHSHMAIVVKHCDKTGYQSSNNNAYGKHML